MNYKNKLLTPQLRYVNGKLLLSRVPFAEKYELICEYIDNLTGQKTGQIKKYEIDVGVAKPQIFNKTNYIYLNTLRVINNYPGFLPYIRMNYNLYNNIELSEDEYGYSFGALFFDKNKNIIGLPYNPKSVNIGFFTDIKVYGNPNQNNFGNYKINLSNDLEDYGIMLTKPFNGYNENEDIYFFEYFFIDVPLNISLTNAIYSVRALPSEVIFNGDEGQKYTDYFDRYMSSSDYSQNVIVNDIKDEDLYLTLYNNKSRNERINKINYLDFYKKLYGTFRDDVSLLSPIIQIENDEPPKCNYCYIPKFKRFYYVNNIIYVNNNFYVLECSVDVLMSNKEDIDGCDVILSRSVNKNNPLLIDDMIPALYDYDVKYIRGNLSPVFQQTNGVKIMADNQKIAFDLIYNVVLTFSSKSSNSKDNDISISNSNGYNQYTNSSQSIIMSKSTLNSFFETLFNFSKEQWGDMFKGTIQNTTDLIHSIKIYPFTLYNNDMIEFIDTHLVEYGNNEPDLYIGSLGFKFDDNVLFLASDYHPYQNNTYKLKDSKGIIIVYGGFIDKVDINSFIDREPFTKYEMYIPFLGFNEIESKYLEKGIYIYYVVDIINGETSVLLTHTAKDENNTIQPFKIYNTNIAIDIPITRIDSLSIMEQTRRNEIQQTELENSIGVNTLFKFGKVATNALIGGTTLGVPGAIGGAIIGTIDIFGGNSDKGLRADSLNSLTEMSVNTLKGNVGVISPSKILSIVNGMYPYIISKKQKLPDNYEEFTNKLGKPSTYVGKVKELEGYFKCVDAYLDGLTCTEIEKQSILKYFLSGVVK